MKVVLADDEKSIRITLGDDIREAGHDVALFDNGQDAFTHIREAGADVIVCDLKMPSMDGIELLKTVKEAYPMIKVILITGYGTVDTAVEAMKFGAFDYVVKPFMNEKIVNTLDNIADMHRIYDENVELKKKFDELSDDSMQFHGMVGTSAAMQDVFRRIESIAATDATVLVEGESGTGKELAARAVHALSARAEQALVVLSCAASPESLIEDELFGHEAGAYTGALKEKKGKFERADGSTLFIDDIDDMSLNMQAKLVRVLQERQFERLGATELIETDFRLVVASKVSLRKLVDDGTFREDLFFRLNIIPVQMPPLRDREGDIELLAHHFKNKYARSADTYFSEETLRHIKTYAWPGNVRELENAVIRAAVLCGDKDRELKKEYIFQAYEADGAQIKPLSDAIKEFEKAHITKVLKSTDFHKTKAAQALGISRKTLWEKVKAYGIEG